MYVLQLCLVSRTEKLAKQQHKHFLLKEMQQEKEEKKEKVIRELHLFIK